MNLALVSLTYDKYYYLYALLKERELSQSISHRVMPGYLDHIDFVDSRPYYAWYFIEHDGHVSGSIYLSKQREIGISVFKKDQKQGVATWAIKELMDIHPGKFLANINPDNIASANLFKKFGFKLIQHTYGIG